MTTLWIYMCQVVNSGALRIRWWSQEMNCEHYGNMPVPLYFRIQKVRVVHFVDVRLRVQSQWWSIHSIPCSLVADWIVVVSWAADITPTTASWQTVQTTTSWRLNKRERTHRLIPQAFIDKIFPHLYHRGVSHQILHQTSHPQLLQNFQGILYNQTRDEYKSGSVNMFV